MAASGKRRFRFRCIGLVLINFWAVRKDRQAGKRAVFTEPSTLTKVNRELMDKALHRAKTAVKALPNTGQTIIKARNPDMWTSGVRSVS